VCELRPHVFVFPPRLCAISAGPTYCDGRWGRPCRQALNICGAAFHVKALNSADSQAPHGGPAYCPYELLGKSHKCTNSRTTSKTSQTRQIGTPRLNHNTTCSNRNCNITPPHFLYQSWDASMRHLNFKAYNDMKKRIILRR